MQEATPGGSSEPRRRAMPAALVALLLVLPAAILAGLGTTSDPDVFWHLALGRKVLQSHSTVPRDVFSFSRAGAEMPHRDLLAAVVFYAGFARWGFPWLAALKSAAGIGIAAGLGLAGPRGHRSPTLIVAAAGLAFASFWLVERPNVFSTAFFSVELALLAEARRLSAGEDLRALRRVLVGLVGLLFLWTWIHRFALMGLGLFVGLALERGLSRGLAATPSGRILAPASSAAAVRETAVAALVAPVLSLANPSGPAVFTSALTMASDPELRRAFTEWRHAGIHELWSSFPVGVVVIAAAALVTAAQIPSVTRGRGDAFWSSAVFVLLGAMTAHSVRWFAYLVVAALHLLICTASARWGTGGGARRPRGLALLAALLAFGGVAWRMDGQTLRPGEEPSFTPRAAVAYIRQRALGGAVANAFDLGGYLIFHLTPGVRVLVDGRNELLYPPAFVLRCLAAEQTAAVFHAMRGIDGATWAVGTNVENKVGFGFLAHDPAWAMVFWSETAAVYVRRDAHPDLLDDAFRFVDPNDVNGAVLAAIRNTRNDTQGRLALEHEVGRMVRASPDSPRALVAQALFLMAEGPRRRADMTRTLDHLLQVTGGSPEAQAVARELLERGSHP